METGMEENIMKIQKRLVSLLLVLMLALGVAGSAFAADPAPSFQGEIVNGILVKYTGNLYTIRAIDFPPTFTVIGASAFKGLPLQYIEMPYWITSIGASAFADCGSLTTAVLTNMTQLKTIQDSTFSNCVELKNIVIPDTVTSIEANAFANCVKLETVKGPAKKVDSINHPVNPTNDNYEAVNGYLASVGTNAFFNCSRVHVWCVKGSALETYCVTNSLNHTSLAPIVDKITVAEPQYTMVNGGEKTIGVTIAPEVATNEALAWTSGNETVASVTQAGVVKGLAPGYVIVTIRGDAYIVGKTGASNSTKVIVLDPAKTWQQMADNYWYYCTGTGVDSFAVGWLQDNGYWYHFDKYGRMEAGGWKKIDGNMYFLSGNGAMLTEWQKIDGKWYYLARDGAMRTGWQKADGKWYYLGADGVMRVSWVADGGRWYYLNLRDGHMETGWQRIDGAWYYFGSDGKMVYNTWLKIDGKWYWFDANGVMATGSRVIDGKTYNFTPEGVWVK